MSIQINTPTGSIDSDDLTAPLPNRDKRDAWRLNGTIIEFDLPTMKEMVGIDIISASQNRILQGVKWHYNGGASLNNIKITSAMRLFLSNTQAAIEHPTIPRPNIHNGELWQDGKTFLIDKDGIVELAVFAYDWGLKISQISQNLITALDDMDVAQLLAYDINLNVWTIAWPTLDANNGWSDDTLTQIP